ncbi:MAG: cbb3-type cytochrome c oxidase subunit I [Planctomycetaceae bacterium]|nr:Cytochrome c oxidase subunit 1, bacteroid [Planctomycetota bacterium]MCQ3949113.1 cytochrome oxidase [Planctomycetota bacterium]NUO17030.1 cbb3-type cytochrome c oxidase subunit I [Planctomycetaceae bacterium]GIK51232.1 MAG: membrane protein [Planctomycetota bacterium]
MAGAIEVHSGATAGHDERLSASVLEPLVDRRIIYAWGLAALFWVTWGPWAGFFTSLKFNFPWLLGDWFATLYGPMRISHTQGVAYGWFSTGSIAFAHYMVPKLCSRPLWKPGLSWAGVILWNVGMVLGIGGVHLGFNQGLEFAEMNLLADVFITLGLSATLTNLFMTIANRREPKIYVSLWYLMAGMTWTAINYIVGNFVAALPNSTGANSAAMNGFFLHNVVGLWVTPMGASIAYYLLPVTTRNPLYSHKLSMIGFWALAFFYPFTGAHHYLFSPIPDWVETIAIVSSLMLIVPVWTVLANFWGTLKGRWDLFANTVVVKFLVLGAVYYLTTCFQGPTQALRALQPVIHFTDYVVGHAHLALFGVFSLWTMAAFYYMIPKLAGREVYSVGLARLNFWLTFFGFLFMALILWIAGIVQGHMLINNTDWPDTLDVLGFYWHIRTIGGFLMDVGMLCFAYNIIATMFWGKPSANPRLV